ncbi:oxidoreductase, short chain dehydrogenase/reductase family [Aspergillus ruber CBS 135680]|uniref:Short-chain dehydrogenase n=1 Tax=Aspergillus ruber (strain CBS 135680) TaxID=1388766 RepID=A0A017S6F4_ASPRC|nr:short-chain dehydrogenase [Aspergillus ruber CBS 135680]EYE91745.1 short-chain dehydrogenase [Aspergillus ruber CBS 135680]
MAPIKETNILVVGGTSGIGYGVARRCLVEGANVHIASSNVSRVSESIDSLKQLFPDAHVTGHVCDLGGQDVEKRLEKLLTTVRPLDHLVFTAGDNISIKSLKDIDLDTIHRAGHVRFFVPLLLGKLAPRFLRPGFRSSFTLTTGSLSEKPLPNWSLVAGYATGLHGMTRSMALDLKPLRVNLVSLGAVETPLWGPKGVPTGAERSTTLGKVGTIDEVAEAYVYFMKDTNATGSVISTNGGALLL